MSKAFSGIWRSSPRGILSAPPSTAAHRRIAVPREEGFLKELESLGETVEGCEPFVEGKVWRRVSGSDVLMYFEESGGLGVMSIDAFS
ncbi:hypothetical protein [Planomonospora venezuelensis]|uniref:Uncharacterized protein n=1 Tax=Planomonospora venezuelensis TaxID=1999 RepID=A0A841CXW1_PLAVE|nr:hypothetical protein [Planomonospora venezuelensis]MBB5961643.1 hypothetical protein [Planomonospora venezuelensis]GIM98789.1 hypothetical protein Pve01_04480 [Planomonospora venezuelensis]